VVGAPGSEQCALRQECKCGAGKGQTAWFDAIVTTKQSWNASALGQARIVMSCTCCVWAFVEIRHWFCLSPFYLSTTANFLADNFSQDNLVSFLLKVPETDSSLSSVSTALLDLLLTPEIDWVSSIWQSLFTDIFKQGSQHPPEVIQHRNDSLFCERFGIFTSFPVTEHLLCSFVAFFADEGPSPQIAKSYLATISILKRVRADVSHLRQQGGSARILLPITQGCSIVSG
jgi:hypothetical protein